MPENKGMVTIEEGDGVKSRPITSRFWLKGGRYRVTLAGDGWLNVTLDQCQIGDAAKPATILNLGSAGAIYFRLKQGFHRFVLKGPVEEQPKSAEIARLEA